MDYYFLDLVSWDQSQALYHAAAHLNHAALFILRPASPYVCLGYHQDAEQEIDLDFAKVNAIPVIRREVGGGAVYLDSGQLFYQLVLPIDHPEIPTNKAQFYRKFLQPVVDTLRQFGVPAEYKPINDIVVNGRKISGNGAAEIEGMIVLVGNFILDFNYSMMSKVLRVPDEKFRDKFYKTLKDNLTTIRREAGRVPNTAALAEALSKRFEVYLGPMTKRTEVGADLLTQADEWISEAYTDEWLYANDRHRLDERQVKISEGIFIVQNILKTPGGLIRGSAINKSGVLQDVHISGDFFVFPSTSLAQLEQALNGVAATSEVVTDSITQFYRQNSIETPGVKPEDIAKVLHSSI